MAQQMSENTDSRVPSLFGLPIQRPIPERPEPRLRPFPSDVCADDRRPSDFERGIEHCLHHWRSEVSIEEYESQVANEWKRLDSSGELNDEARRGLRPHWRNMHMDSRVFE